MEGRAVPLTGKEYAILELLALRKGTVLTKQAFLNHLYGDLDEPEIKVVDVFICKLRKKLMRAGAGNPIDTVWGRGYMLHDPREKASNGSFMEDESDEGGFDENSDKHYADDAYRPLIRPRRALDVLLGKAVSEADLRETAKIISFGARAAG